MVVFLAKGERGAARCLIHLSSTVWCAGGTFSSTRRRGSAGESIPAPPCRNAPSSAFSRESNFEKAKKPNEGGSDGRRIK